MRVAGNGDAALRVVDVATRRERALRRGSPAFAWAPDGTRIAVATLVRSTAWLAVHRPDGRLVERRRAFRAPQRRGWRAGLASLSWSRRGFLVGVLYCASECRGVDPASIRYFHVGGAGSPVLEIGRRQLHDPATTARPSPSGELIAFVADGKVYVQRLGGPTSAAADAPALLYARLAWSSDGRTVLAAGGDVLFAVDARTGRVERLAEGSERHAFHDVWAGHGGRLAVYVTGPRSFLELRSAATGALLARTRHSFGGDGDVRWP